MGHAIINRKNQSLGNPPHDRSISDIIYFVWHYTATNNSFISNHEVFWRDTHGWDRGGYHFYIDRAGNIYQNYDLTQTTWGVGNSNSYTAHVSVEAASKYDYTQAQINARDWLTRAVLPQLNLDGYDMRGHFEVNNNSVCPGYSSAELSNFRNQLASGGAVDAGSVVSGGTKYKDEHWWMEVNTDIIVRNAPSLSATQTGVMPAGEVIEYTEVHNNDNHMWIKYEGNSGNTLYMPYREIGSSHPDWATPLDEAPKEEKPVTEKGEENIYTVQSGDTLYSIAQANNTSVAQLAEWNNLNENDVLSIGQELNVAGPVDTHDNEVVHTVQSGDTLYSIAQEYDVTVNQLTEWNSIDKNDILSIGQELEVTGPMDAPSEFKQLNVGDTATIGIWATHYSTGEEISDWIKGVELTVGDDRTERSTEYRLYNGDTPIGWVLDQDIVEADDGRRSDEIKKMQQQQVLVEQDKVEVVEEKSVEEAKEDEGSEPETYTLKEGQFILNGKKYQIVEIDK